MTNIMHIKPPIYEILFTPSFISISYAHISESALLVTTSPRWVLFDTAIYQSFGMLSLISTTLSTVLIHHSAIIYSD